MDNLKIQSLIDFGYTMAQISQFIKFENDGIDIVKIIDEHPDLVTVDVSKLRDLRDFMAGQKKSFSSDEKTLLFKYLSNGIDYKKPFELNLKRDNAFFVLFCDLQIKLRALDLNINLLMNPKYSLEFLQRAWDDYNSGLSINIYLTSDLPLKKIDILREGMINDIDLTDDLKQFKFLDESDIENLKTLHEKEYDYKAVLKKIKDTAKTIYICAQEENGIDLLKYVNSHMSLSAIETIANFIKKGEKVSMLKSLPITDADTIPLLIKIYNRKLPLKKYKDYGASKLKSIIYALDCNVSTELLDYINEKFISTDIIYLLADCYKYNQTNYIEFIKEKSRYISFYSGYVDGFRNLLVYNFENNDSVFDIKELLQNGDDIISNDEFRYYVDKITSGILTKEIYDKLKPYNFSVEQLKIILKCIKDGLKIDCLLDNRLSISQMRAIKTCLELGLELNKTKSYDLEPVKEKKPYKESHDSCIYDEFNDDYIIISEKFGNKIIYRKY